MCLNPAAAESILPLSIKRTEMVLAGLSKAQMIDSIKTGFHNKELPVPGAGRDVLHDVARRLPE